MSAVKDITGQRFGSLTVSKRHGSVNGRAAWLCVCDCGSEHVGTGKEMRSGRVTSCGCGLTRSNRRATHGKSKSKIYSVWTNMKLRCESPTDASYQWYGARGITVSEEWSKSFDAFYADMGDAPDGCSLDRIDVDGPYSKENCKWATTAEQSRNRRNNRNITINGVTKIMSDWCSENGIYPSTASRRIKNGWDAQVAVSQPTNHQA
jgi:hypothetical protein